MVLLAAENVDRLILEDWRTHGADSFADAASSACCLLAAVHKVAVCQRGNVAMLHCKGVAACN